MVSADSPLKKKIDMNLRNESRLGGGKTKKEKRIVDENESRNVRWLLDMMRGLDESKGNLSRRREDGRQIMEEAKWSYNEGTSMYIYRPIWPICEIVTLISNVSLRLLEFQCSQK